MNPPKHSRKKRRKRSHDRNQGEGDYHRHSSDQPAPSHSPSKTNNDWQQKLHHRHVDSQKRHQEALALSQQLRQLSSQKRLKECIDTYRSSTYDELRDAHHGSIVIDCCARCGDVEEAEKLLNEMLQSPKSEKREPRSYFWKGYKHFSYKKVPIQAWTALLKGYVHSGMMAKADSLFHYLCAKTFDEGNKQRKRKRGAENGPNVRTLNTLLRGCLWTATSLNGENDGSEGAVKNEMVGGIMTAERAWSRCEGNVSCDSSSYEYFISILSQSLQCKRAEDCLQNMRSEFGIPDRIHDDLGKNKLDNMVAIDPTLIETLVVCLVSIARGYSMLGKMNDATRCVGDALHYLDASSAVNKAGSSTSDNARSTKKQTTGGKKAWKDGRGQDLRDDGNSNGRREESNKLFRNHRQSELRSEALALQNLCSEYSSTSSKQGKQAKTITTSSASHMAHFLLTRLLYFSGGGTTGKDATKSATSSTKASVDEVIQQWIHSLWHSFGLKEAVQRLHKEEKNTLNNIFTLTPSKSQLKKSKHTPLPSVLSPEECGRLREQLVGENKAISSDGRINFEILFTSLNDNTATSQSGEKKPLHIELGAGSGDWAALQAKLNPSGNYVTVELRADRVGQTFTKCLLHQDADGKCKNVPLVNLCCVGSECGSFLRDRVESGSVKTIFVNHPEPPTQTYNAAPTIGSNRSGDIDIAHDIGAEEPSHMLNSQILLSAARCLESNGKGRMIIVTDNLIYARLICRTLAHVLEEGAKIVGLSPGEVRDLRWIETFGHSSIHLYEGKPSLSIGHYIPQQLEGGTSYFDRLWRTGAGKYADMRKRFIIALKTDDGNISVRSKESKRSHGATQSGMHKHSPKSNGEEKKPNKKKSAEKQRRRNERRMLKKQQLAEKVGEEQ